MPGLVAPPNTLAPMVHPRNTAFFLSRAVMWCALDCKFPHTKPAAPVAEERYRPQLIAIGQFIGEVKLGLSLNLVDADFAGAAVDNRD